MSDASGMRVTAGPGEPADADACFARLVTVLNSGMLALMISVGERVGLHPVWLIFAMFAFGYLFGFVGLLVAVPLAAVAAVLVRFALRRYLVSPLYKGEEPIR